MIFWADTTFFSCIFYTSPWSNSSGRIKYNKIQSYGFTSEVLNLEPLRDKWESFNFDVSEVNGHDLKQLKKSFLKSKLNKPRLTICHTIKGKGFSFSENNPKWHHKNFFTDEEKKQLKECLEY